MQHNNIPQEPPKAGHRRPGGQLRKKSRECLRKTTLCYQLLSPQGAKFPGEFGPTDESRRLGTLYAVHKY